MTIQQIRKEVTKLDPNLNSDDNSFKSATILLSLAEIGPSSTIKQVASFTELPRGFVAKRMANLRTSNVIKNGKLAVDWFDKKNGGVAFWMDVAVAEGWLERR